MTTTPPLPHLGATRSQVLALLQDTPGHLTVPHIADQLGLHRNSARFHLDALVEAGYAVRVPGTPSGQGRPPMLYAATRDAPAMRNTHLLELAEILLDHLSGMPDAKDVGRRTGRSWGARKAPAPSDDDAVVDALASDLSERGFGALRDGAKLCFARCPFRDVISQEQLPLVCAMHEGFIDGYLESAAGGLRAGRLRIGYDVCSIEVA